MTFDDSTWRFVAAAARHFAHNHPAGSAQPPFGYRDDDGRWWWWDGTTTDYSILETEHAAAHVHRYLEVLFPTAKTIEVTERT